MKGVEIRKLEQLSTINTHVIQGGESTTMAKLAEYHNLVPSLCEFVKIGKPVWWTCAGLIFLADKTVGQKVGGQELMGGLDCTVHRNYLESQIQSFEVDLAEPELAAKEGGPTSFCGVFIRAPAILEAGREVDCINEARKFAGAAFHPEFTADTRWHSYFLKMVKEEEQTAPISKEECNDKQPLRIDLPIF